MFHFCRLCVTVIECVRNIAVVNEESSRPAIGYAERFRGETCGPWKASAFFPRIRGTGSDLIKM